MGASWLLVRGRGKVFKRGRGGPVGSVGASGRRRPGVHGTALPRAGRRHGPDMIPRFFLLAAGVGSRLRPLTDRCPKALVEIGGRPLLDRWFHRIEAVANGLAEIRINAHHLREQIVARTNVYREQSSSSWSVCHEDSLLGTAGTLFRHLDWIDSSTGSAGSIVIYADNFSSIDLGRFWSAHLDGGADATIALFRASTPESCGVVELSNTNIIIDFEEKPKKPKSSLANAGILAFKPGVLRSILNPEDHDMAHDVLPRCVGRAVGWRIDGFHYDIGTKRDLDLVRHKVETGEITL